MGTMSKALQMPAEDLCCNPGMHRDRNNHTPPVAGLEGTDAAVVPLDERAAGGLLLLLQELEPLIAAVLQAGQSLTLGTHSPQVGNDCWPALIPADAG